MATTTQNLAGFGFATALGMGKEATFGVAVTPSIYIPFAQAAFTLSNKLVKRIGVRKTKGQTLSGIGQIDLKGSLDLECEPDTIGFLLGAGMGADVVTTPATGIYTHTMKLASPLNTYTATVDYAKNVLHQFAGCKIDGLDISVKPDSFLMAKVSLVGQTDIPLTGQSLSPTFGNIPPFEFEHITGASSATIAGVQYPLDNFSVSLKNNLKPFFGSGSGRLIRNINETNAMVTGSFTLPYENDTIYNAVLNVTPVPISLTFTHTTLISGTTPYSITLNMPNCILESAPLDPKRGDVVMYNVKFSGFESVTGAQDDLNLILTNGTAAAYI